MSKLQCQLIATALEANQTIKKRIQLPLESILLDTFSKPAFYVQRAAGELAPLERRWFRCTFRRSIWLQIPIFFPSLPSVIYIYQAIYICTIIAMLSSKSYLLRYRDNEHGKIMTKAVRLFLFLHFLLPRQAFKGSHWDSSREAKLYIPSTINIWKKALTKAIWADKKWAGFWQISLHIK